jgi:hypothetical protein
MEHFISLHLFTYRFILEPKSVMMTEQEQKLNESENAISTMQVHLAEILFHSLSCCIGMEKMKRSPNLHFYLML